MGDGLIKKPRKTDQTRARNAQNGCFGQMCHGKLPFFWGSVRARRRDRRALCSTGLLVTVLPQSCTITTTLPRPDCRVIARLPDPAWLTPNALLRPN